MRKWVRCLAFATAVFACRGAAAAPVTVLVEAGSFADHGGWVLDQQSMDQMGSAYLLAHGLGTPVADATTAVSFPETGEYRVWVRTRDWVGLWKTAETPRWLKAEGYPGRFQVIVDGKVLGTVFGTEDADWHWQDGGTVRIDRKRVSLALHDLTGFEGRCDAILLSKDSDLVPPNQRDEMARFRKRLLGLPDVPPDAGRFDLVVTGGGIAGTCAAVSAARLGLEVALIQDRPLLGGNNSSEVRVHLGGKIQLPPYRHIGDLVSELGPLDKVGNAQPAETYQDGRKLRLVEAEPNVSLFLNMHANAVEKSGDCIKAIRAVNTRTGRELRFPAPLFADCTGDGTIGFLAGAEYRMGRESRVETGESLAPEKPDKMTMGSSIQWYSVPTQEPTPFPRCPWAARFNERNCQDTFRGEWDWETGLNRNQITEIESIRDHALRVVYGNWAFLKNSEKRRARYSRRTLGWVSFVAGKRESRRLLGDVILTEQDVIGNREYPDACVTSTWSIDLHYPAPDNSKNFPGHEFRTIARHKRIKPYPIPYRCLYSRNVENLFMAGRDISVTHVALGTVRVMRTCGMMGEVVGMAASICKKHDTVPRSVYGRHLDELKAIMERGVGRND